MKTRVRTLWVHTVLGFPSPLVYDAYVSPTVDETRGKFTWGKPDVDVLREYVYKSLFKYEYGILVRQC